MGSAKPWHEREAFWKTACPVLFSERRITEAPVEVDRIVTLLAIKENAHLLDLCCGIGRHSLEFARRGFEVTAVDRTRFYLDIASQKARAAGLSVEFVHADMRDFYRDGAFDVIVNLFTSFGYFEDPEEDRRAVENVYRSLKPGGIFLLETMGKEILARIFLERNWRQEGEMIILEERKICKNWSWCDNHWMILKGDSCTEFNVSHRLYSAVELSALLAECGFAEIDVYGGLEGGEYDHTARRLAIVAHK
jgi:SAM-dependent methyltransferase